MSVKVEGLDEVLGALSEIGDEQQLKRALTQACQIVEGEAKRKAGSSGIKDTGALSQSIESNVEKHGNELVGVVFTPLEYAPYVEYGTGMFAEKGGRQGYWVYVKDGGSGKKAKKVGKTYTREEARRVMAMLRAKGLEAYYTCGQHPQPFLRPALHENRETILRTLKGGLKK